MTNQDATADRADHDEYDYYLGIFVFLGAVLMGTAAWYGWHYHGFPYVGLAWTSAILSVAIPLAYGRQYHLMSDRRKPIPLASKKAMLIVALAFYVVGASLLTMWGGGRQSAASNLLLLTSGLSVYVAREPGTKLLVGVIAMVCYAGTSFYWFDVQKGMTMIPVRDGGVWFDFGLVLAIMLVTGRTSLVIERRRVDTAVSQKSGQNG